MSQSADVLALLERVLSEPPRLRKALLERIGASDPALRARVERLLHLAETGDGFLDRAALRTDAAMAPTGNPWSAGRRIGAYRLLRPLGQGGMAEVWLAERSEGGFHQLAALKLIPSASASLTERFAAERDILATLAHPHIARLYDGGIDADGAAYMVMEYVEGEHLIAYANAHSLPLTERLALFLQICDAVAYAHTRLVVHRDLKPANVLVTAEGQAMLLDFGIAKLIGADVGPERTHTLYLSPTYAAPEQLTGDAIGTATDVYALGVILFELLAGHLPWRDDASPMATAMQRLLDQPPPPSRVAGADAPFPARALRGDLDAIVGKALRREPDRRYVDARALGDDIRSHLDHRPVQARSGARAYAARRFLRRNWLPLTAAALLFVAMAAGTGAVAWQANRTHLAAQRAEAVQAFMVDLFKMNSIRQKDPVKARLTTVRELLDIGAAQIEQSLDDAPENKLALLRVFSSLYEDGLAEGYPSVPLMQKAVALSRSLYGEDSIELAEDRIHLAKLLCDQGKRAEARELLQAAAGTLDRRGDHTSELRGRLHVVQAFSFLTQNDRRTCEEADAAIAVLRAFPPSRDLELALFYKSLTATSTYGIETATQSLQEAIRISRSIDGDSDPMLSTYYMNLAQLQRKAWDMTAAESTARQALDVALKDKSEFAYDRTLSMSTIASIQLAGGRIKESLESARQAAQWLTGPAGGANEPILSARVRIVFATTLGAAGELDDGLAQALAAVKLLRGTTFDSHLASALNVAADRFIELGRLAEAKAMLDEAQALYQRVDGGMDQHAVLRWTRIALDSGDTTQARSLLAGYAGTSNPTKDAAASSFRHALLEAETELQTGDAEASARHAASVNEQMRASDLAPYLRPLIADGEWLEGLSRTRGGNASAAQSLLERSLATRTDLYLPKSPKIAEAELALAECELAQGRHDAAARHVAAAAAIAAQHSSLSERYTRPLQQLRDELARR